MNISKIYKNLYFSNFLVSVETLTRIQAALRTVYIVSYY